MERPSWDETFMAVAEEMRKRSTCLRRQVGAVIVNRAHRQVSGGYNGAPPKFKHCAEVGCLREKLGIPSGERHEICRGLHAEMNAILWAPNSSGGGCTLYTTDSPCSICARLIVGSPVGIERVVYGGEYPDEFTAGIFAEAGVELVKFEKKGEER